MNTACNAEAEVTISGFRYRYRRWHPGERLRGHLMAIDTETALIDGHQVPSLALATASGDRWHVLIHPDDLGHFILTHSHMKFVGHNVAFDYWVIHDHLLARNEFEALEAWKKTVVERRLHDTMLLDMLLRLERSDSRSLKNTCSGKRTGRRKLRRKSLKLCGTLSTKLQFKIRIRSMSLQRFVRLISRFLPRSVDSYKTQSSGSRRQRTTARMNIGRNQPRCMCHVETSFGVWPII